VHLGFEGYRSVAKDDLKNARLLSRALEKCGWYTVLSDIHRPKLNGLLQRSTQGTVGFDEENPEVSIPLLVSNAF
jgi:glutamate decarboxylase